VVNVTESPAVAPMESGGDARLGFLVAGSFLILVGWGLGVLANLFLHALAPASGLVIGPWVIFHALGPYAQATLIMGLVTGAIGTGMLVLSRRMTRGPFVLPGQPF
jgi:hypothetical protein